MKQLMVDNQSAASHSFLLDDDSSIPFSLDDIQNLMEDRVRKLSHAKGAIQCLRSAQCLCWLGSQLHCQYMATDCLGLIGSPCLHSMRDSSADCQTFLNLMLLTSLGGKWWPIVTCIPSSATDESMFSCFEILHRQHKMLPMVFCIQQSYLSTSTAGHDAALDAGHLKNPLNCTGP